MKRPRKLNNDFFKNWRYNAADRAANETAIGEMGLRATISQVSEVSFSLRMRINGERRSKKVGHFQTDHRGSVVYGLDEAATDAMALRKRWRDEAEGKIVADPKDVPNLRELFDRYHQALVDGDELMPGREVPKSWDDTLPLALSVYEPLLSVNTLLIAKKNIHEAHTVYLSKRMRATGRKPNSSVRLAFNFAHPVFVWAHEKAWMRSDTLLGLRANVPKEKSRDRIIGPREWQAIAPVLDGMYGGMGLLPRYLLATACRLSMATSMRWGDVRKINAGTVDDPKPLTIWCVPAENMKQGFLAMFPIVDEAERIIETLRNLPGADTAAHAYVFPENVRSGWMTNTDRWQKIIFKASGTKRWHRHDLRRTMASVLDVLGADLPTVKRLLAHMPTSDRSATKTYLKIGDNVGPLLKLAEYLKRAHKMFRDIEQGRMTRDVTRLIAALETSEPVQQFLHDLSIDRTKFMDIVVGEPPATNVVELRPAHG